jgi:hypothetical protein
MEELSYEARLKLMAGETGEVHSHVGGVEIIVKDASNFPWDKILSFLLNTPQDVWIVKANDTLVIKTKPVSI